MTALDAASGAISLADSFLVNSLTNSSAFQTWVGAATAADAAEHIHFDATPENVGGVSTRNRDEMDAMRPFAVLGVSSVQRAREGTDYRRSGGSIDCHFEQSVTKADEGNPSSIGRRFRNVIGDIMEDILALADDDGGATPYLAANGVSFEGPFREDENETDRYIYAAVTVFWGNQDA